MAENNEFGAFFRERRKALGLSLREFCRRAGFDQANVSRMERGLLPPPKSKKVLSAYAKGLKLKPGSTEWEQFMTLANPPAKPRRGLGHKNWVKARNLEHWAGTLDAREMLPQVIRRLIRATGDGIIRLDAPSGDQTQRPGWDGLCEAAGDNEFVPEGVSAWEMGTEKDPKAKAEEDFAKRLKKTPGISKPKTSFFFVTPRKWQKKDEWVEAKKKLKIWNDVRVLDSASLEEWLECAPAVDIWLAGLLGLRPKDVSDVDDRWKNLQALTDPSLEADVYLVSRGEQLKELKQWLEGPPDALLIESRSPVEAVDFVVAASRKTELGEAFAAKAVIVETRDAWRTLAGGDAKLILIADPSLSIEAELVAEAIRNGHHAIVCSRFSQGSPHRSIQLPRVSSLDLQKVLEAQKITHTEAERLAAASGGSLAVLKRRISRHPGTVHPQWSLPPHSKALVPLLLAGRWDESVPGDRLVLEKLTEGKYRDVETLADQWSACADPVLTRSLSRWELVSRDDSWALLSSAISDNDLKRFEAVALEVLGETDSALDLPEEDRWQASAVGKVRQFSGLLRAGLAESLALLGARPPEKNHLTRDPRGQARHIVKSLLYGKDWKTWASLKWQLTLLAESSPDEFLTALENDLTKRSPAVTRLFESVSSPLFGSNLHVDLLFALDILAWDPRSLSRASRLLAQIQQATGMMNSGNSPLRTLQHIFMPWYPQTTVPVEDRVTLLYSLAKSYPDVVWKLLLELLKHHPSLDLICRPSYQNWALDWTGSVTRGDAVFQLDATSNLMVELAGKDPARLKDAIRTFESLPESGRTRLLDRITELVPSELIHEDRRALAEAIREKVNRHRRFEHTDWAMKEDVLKRLDQVREHIEPEDLVSRNGWLFGDYWKIRDEIARGKVSLDEDETVVTKQLEEMRGAALKAVREERGWDGVLALAEIAESPGDVGLTVGISDAAGDDARILPALLVSPVKKLAQFAKVFVAAKRHIKGPEWTGQLKMDEWSDAESLEFALALPPERTVWDIVAKRGVKTEEEYWKKLRDLCLSREAGDISRAARMIARTGRPFFAVRQLGLARNRNVKLDTAVIFDVLESGHKVLAEPEQQKAMSDVHHDVGILVQMLQQRLEATEADVDINRLASIEMFYLELLDGHPTTAKTLHQLLEQKPEFFVELIAILTPGDDERKERAELSERDRMRAMNVYRLLHSWQRVPGSRPDGSIGGESLRNWLRSVQKLAKNESGRTMSDLKIGAVFAYAPKESDGSWPCIAVRDAIEEFGSEALAEGFEVGIMNMRGAYFKALDEGGHQERAIAQDFHRWAEASRIEWPKTATSLQRVGDHYEAYARREDAEGESGLRTRIG